MYFNLAWSKSVCLHECGTFAFPGSGREQIAEWRQLSTLKIGRQLPLKRGFRSVTPVLKKSLSPPGTQAPSQRVNSLKGAARASRGNPRDTCGGPRGDVVAAPEKPFLFSDRLFCFWKQANKWPKWSVQRQLKCSVKWEAGGRWSGKPRRSPAWRTTGWGRFYSALRSTELRDDEMA